jgi:hypothetical protein
MKHFYMMEIREAVDYANAGGMALHTHRIIVDRDRAPRCFVAAVDRGENIAHLFCNDVDKLTKVVRKLGVRVVYVDCEGVMGDQHIDLCGAPLTRALKMCEDDAQHEEQGMLSLGD